MNTSTCAYARRGVDGLAQIGATRFDVVGIRFFDGEQAAGGSAPEGEQQQEATPPWGDDPTKFDPGKAWNLIQNLRTDLSAEKGKRDTAIAEAVAAAEKSILGSIAKALGGGEQQETDPAKLQQSVADLTSTVAAKDSELTAAAAQVKAGQVALQVALHAPALGGNTALLLANEQFKNSIASVEPTDEAAIKAEITKALQANAALKQPPTRSGDVTPTGPTVQSLQEQLATAQKDGDIPTTIALKRRLAEAQAKS